MQDVLAVTTDELPHPDPVHLRRGDDEEVRAAFGADVHPCFFGSPRWAATYLAAGISGVVSALLGRFAKGPAAIAAGGDMVSDENAPGWWTLADTEGNEVDVASWPDRD